ncbi:MAG TPA: hypothetical protein VMM38_08805 [Aridibacter sp.]|nr:hypothetical protein [Aridibacter sp.]
MKPVLSVLVLVIASVIVFPQESQSSAYTTITPGKGIEGLEVGATKIEAVIEALGDDYELLVHKNYSHEFSYPSLGVSFWVCQKGFSKGIFSAEFRYPYPGETKDGIRIGVTTLGEVVERLGEPESTYSFNNSFGYDGIQFHYGDWYLEHSLSEKQIRAKKILTITVFEPGGVRQCESSPDGKYSSVDFEVTTSSVTTTIND